MRNWKRSDIIALAAFIVSVLTASVSIYYSYTAYNMQKSQNSISVISGFSNRDVVDAGSEVISWSRNLPKTEDQLIEFRRETSPMGRHLQTLAACLTSDVCDRDVMLKVFCLRAPIYNDVVKNAFASADVPKQEDDEFYLSALALCEEN